MLALLIAAALVSYLVYRYYENERHYWTKKGIPGPPAAWLWGNLRELTDSSLPRSLVLRDWTQKYGKVYGYHEGQRKQLVISDMRMLEEMMTKKFDNFHSRARFALQPKGDGPKRNIIQASGNHWRRLRALGSPAFSNNALKQILPTVEKSAGIMLDFLSQSSDQAEVNMLELFQEFTMDIISKLAMGQRDAKMFQNPYTAVVKGIFTRPGNSPISMVPNLFPFLVVPWRSLLAAVGGFFDIAFIKLINDIERAVTERKAERAAGRPSSTDFVDMFLDAEVDASEIKFNNEDNGTISRSLVFDEVVRLCLIFMIAGFDTTANSLAYVTHFLANYPEVQERMHEEIEAVCTDQEVSYDQLGELKYTEAVLKESLRHYPLASVAVSRECARSTTLGDLFVEVGTMIQTDTWSLHMDEEVWGADAKEFRPERWFEESERSRVAFQAFGAGPRICLGMRLAFLEEKMLLAHLSKRFRFVQSVHTNPLRLFGSLGVAPREVLVKVEKRTV